MPHFGRSNGWHGSYIAKILNNKAVIGEFQPHKRDASGRSISDGIAIESYFPAIVEHDLFYRAQTARAERDPRGLGAARGRKGPLLASLFSQLLRCEYCDRKMLLERKGNGPEGSKYFVCDGVRRGLGCKSARWRYDEFEASFLAFVRELDLDRILSDDSNAAARSALDHKK